MFKTLFSDVEDEEKVFKVCIGCIGTQTVFINKVCRKFGRFAITNIVYTVFYCHFVNYARIQEHP